MNYLKGVGVVFFAFMLVGCISTSVMPLQKNVIKIDASASKYRSRSATQEAITKKAAEETLDYGYSSFIITSVKSWSDMGFSGGRYGQSRYKSGRYEGSGYSTYRNAEGSAIVVMYKNGEKGAKNAIDAREYLRRKS